MTTVETRPDATHLAVMDTYRTVGARNQHETYLSMPMTTGAAYAEWRAANPHIQPGTPQYDQGRAAVLTANRRKVEPLLADLRTQFYGALVISPGALSDVEGWGQSEYLALWCDVIRTFVSVVVFADGWEYSTGCATEFAAAVEAGVSTVDERLHPIGSAQGRAMVTRAARQMAEWSESTDGLRAALAKLDGAA